MKKKTLFFILISFLFLAVGIEAKAAVEGQIQKFNIEGDFDLEGRDEISATLIKITPQLYFYAKQDWWFDLNYYQQNEVRNNLTALSNEFEKTIYPKLTAVFGSEWQPGIDKDNRITILLHPMIETAGSYFRTIDEYPKAQNPESNEKEMIYLNTKFIDSERLKMFLAHEFVHLITFNQKDRKYQIEEDVWLNEIRAEFASTFLGYDDDFEKSNLKPRLKEFLNSPTNSLTECQNKPEDYGVINLFMQYLIDLYGKEILIDSLASEKTGIESLNWALEKNGFNENFSQIFTDWTITLVVNNCSIGQRYCYKNQYLKNLKITPSINFLPIEGESTLATTTTTKNWAGNWYKFVGGRGSLRVEFIGDPKNLFKVPYVLHDLSGNQEVGYFDISGEQRGEFLVPNFGSEIISFTIIPTAQKKTFGFLEDEETVAIFWSASTTQEKEILPKYLEKPITEMSKEEILAKISEIEEVLKKLREQLSQLTIYPTSLLSCQSFDNNLFFGMRNNPEVFCLQEFLKSQDQNIYPEGLVTGNFFNLTKTAVERFQEKYAVEILHPIGLQNGTGFVGPMTRAKINTMLR